jgi:cell pole-organizing protein PopZ
MSDERNEPSMEAILSSIKKIIAEDSPAETPRRAARASAKADSVSAAAEHDGDHDVERGEDVLELTQSADEELLDTGKAEKLAQSFTVLKTLAEPGVAPQIVRAGETSLEGLTRDLLRPMLKDWLDSNLPNMVESLVAKEIERITKKG